MQQKEKTKKEIMQSVPDGGTLTLPLAGENLNAWRVRAAEINRDEGYEHYSITANSRLNQLTIIANV